MDLRAITRIYTILAVTRPSIIRLSVICLSVICLSVIWVFFPNIKNTTTIKRKGQATELINENQNRSLFQTGGRRPVTGN